MFEVLANCLMRKLSCRRLVITHIIIKACFSCDAHVRVSECCGVLRYHFTIDIELRLV